MNKDTTSQHVDNPSNGFGKQQFREKLEERWYRGLNYLSIYVYILVVYGGALITDYLLFALMEWLLRDYVLRYLIVALWFDYARIGLALLFIVAAVIHGVIATFGQVKLDLVLTRESEAK